jgi:hypothetical protein
VQRGSLPYGRLDITALAVYAALVLCMWLWYGLHSGMGYETGFPLASESTGRGRHFGIDIRRFTAFFYHMAYDMGSRLGFAGSYVPYQITYALLWFLRGVLVLQLVRMLGDRRGVLAFLAGAFTILHAADASLNWVGQLNQFGFIFWMLLAFVALLKAFELQHRMLIAVPLTLIATQLARICIYSYESPLPLIFAFPVLALTLFLGWSWRRTLMLGVFYSLPLLYVWRWIGLALEPRSGSDYQFSVLRHDWSPLAIARDWVTDTWHSLAFWQWPSAIAAEPGFRTVALACAAAAALAVAAGYLGIARWSRAEQGTAGAGGLEIRFLALGIALVVLSFPAYLLLENATNHWRTQLLSGPGMGIAWASVLALAARRWHRARSAAWLSAAVAAAVAANGAWASQASAFKHRMDWEEHRALVSAVLSVAPRIADDTVVVLVNHRAGSLIFGHNMWWDYAVRLAYPEKEVAGVYYDRPRQVAPGVRMSFADAYAFIDSDAEFSIDIARMDQLIVLEALPGGRVAVAPTLPEWFGIAPQHRHWYDPQRRIGPWPPDERAVRRFGPIPGQD